MAKNVNVNVSIPGKMKEALKKSLQASVREPLQNILKILTVRDSDRNKLRAIEFYCRKTLAVVDKTIEENLK